MVWPFACEVVFDRLGEAHSVLRNGLTTLDRDGWCMKVAVYRDQVLPRIIDKTCSMGLLSSWRERCLDGLSGTVVEPGFGSGTNVPFYPPEVDKVFAVDPATLGQRLASDRVSRSPIRIEFVDLDGQALPLATASCDAGVLTFTLCTIPDPMQALRELYRVIKPGGAIHLLEHGRSPDATTERWQHRIDPIQRRLFDGCHISRDHPALLQDAGFQIDWMDSGYAQGPRPWVYFYVGRAVRP